MPHVCSLLPGVFTLVWELVPGVERPPVSAESMEPAWTQRTMVLTPGRSPGAAARSGQTCSWLTHDHSQVEGLHSSSYWSMETRSPEYTNTQRKPQWKMTGSKREPGSLLGLLVSGDQAWKPCLLQGPWSPRWLQSVCLYGYQQRAP